MSYTYHSLYGIDVSIVRYFTVYGPAGRPDMAIFRFINAILRDESINVYGDGAHGRDFTFVDDIAAGTIAAAKPVGYEIFNLGGGNNPITINQVIEMCSSLIGKAPMVNYLDAFECDMVNTWADIGKASSVLHWKPMIALAEGLRRTVEWHRAHPEF